MGRDVRKISIDPLSPTSIYLEFFFNETRISTGTGFFVERGGSTYLVSNLHNFTGRDTFTGEHLSKTLAEPNRVGFLGYPNGDINESKPVSAPLIGRNGEELFRRNTNHGCPVDIGVLPLGDFAKYTFPINRCPQHKLKPTVSSEIFVLGYPAGLGNHITPIWKSGTVATEPEIPYENMPTFLIDSATVKGMSGSPVILRSRILHHPKGIIEQTENFQRLLGVYSGRIPKIDGVDTNLGMVWHAHLIYEIIDQRIYDLDFWDSSIPNDQGEPPPGWGSW